MCVQYLDLADILFLEKLDYIRLLDILMVNSTQENRVICRTNHIHVLVLLSQKKILQ